jgi:tRNA-binding protein
VKEIIGFSDFEKIDMRVGEVISVEQASGTRKPSVKITIDLGDEGIKSSIGQYALIDPSLLIGKKVVTCCNLGNRKMGKYTSEVLILGSPHPDNVEGQFQALPIFAHPSAKNGDHIY